MILYRLLGTAALAVLLAGCQSEPTIQSGPNAEVSYDGLHKVDNSRMRMVWAKPDLDLSGYTKIRLIGEGIEYRAVKPAGRTMRANSSRSDFPMDAKQRARLEEVTREVFLDELGKSKYFTIVDEEGPDVLELRGALLDVVSNVPPLTAGRTDFYLSRIGEATLVVELRDSESNEILVRAIDRRGVDPVVITRSTSVQSVSEIRREWRRWGLILREALDSFHESHAN